MSASKFRDKSFRAPKLKLRFNIGNSLTIKFLAKWKQHFQSGSGSETVTLSLNSIWIQWYKVNLIHSQNRKYCADLAQCLNEFCSEEFLIWEEVKFLSRRFGAWVHRSLYFSWSKELQPLRKADTCQVIKELRECSTVWGRGHDGEWQRSGLFVRTLVQIHYKKQVDSSFYNFLCCSNRF